MKENRRQRFEMNFFETPFGNLSSFKDIVYTKINEMSRLRKEGSACYFMHIKGENTKVFHLAATGNGFYQCIGHSKVNFKENKNQLKRIIAKEDVEKFDYQINIAVKNPNQVVKGSITVLTEHGVLKHLFCNFMCIKIVGGRFLLLCTLLDLNLNISNKSILSKDLPVNGDFSQRLKWIMNEIPCGIALFQFDGVWTFIQGNEQFFHPVGYVERDLIDKPDEIYHIIYEKDHKLLDLAKQEAILFTTSKEYEVRMITKQGAVKWFVMKVRLYQRGDIIYLLVANWDIDNRKHMEQELYLQTERYELVESINDEIAFDVNVVNQKMLIPKKYNLLCGEKDNENYMVNILDLKGRYIDPQDFDMFCDAIEDASIGEKKGVVEYRLNIRKQHDKPEYCWHRTYYKSILGMDGTVIRILGRTSNINSEKLEKNKMAEQLKKDLLTGILNKAAVKDDIEKFLGNIKEGVHALFLIDIDNFKMINDTFGHMFGDTVLISIAEKLTSLYRSTDIIGRIGGDEFLVLMKYTNIQQIEEKAAILCETIRHSYRNETKDVLISCSVGISLYDRDGIDYSMLFQKADLAMYQAKESGKNRYQIVEPNRINHVVRRIRFEERGGHYDMSKGQDEDFIVVAFNLLSHAKDLDHSINILMERIGMRYQLGRVALLEHYAESKQLYQTNCWTKENGILEEDTNMDSYEYWDGFFDRFDDRKLQFINDCIYGEEVTENDRKIFKERSIYALVNCGFSLYDKREVIITFCDLEHPRNWTDFEKETFLELTHILSVFVSLRVQREEDKRAIKNLKKKDPLTGIYNEIVFKQLAKNILSGWDEEYQYAVIFSDINDFSYVNENFGHDAGNRILIDYANQISGDDRIMSCRLYSDLFISLIWDKDKDSIIKKTNLRNQIFVEMQKKKYPASGLHIITGIYFLEDNDTDIEIAIENANLTRKSVKRQSNVTLGVYKKELRLQRELEKKVATQFQRILKDHCINVYLQPKFLLKDRKVCGAEALARWEDEKGNGESPEVFIPVLEKLGYIVELDFYVFEQILLLMKKWLNDNRELPVISINFSRKHFDDAGIYHRICELVDFYQIPHKCIEIEITESLLVLGIDLVKKEMELLRQAGFRVAIDDFGTGYSSLNMLLDVPADIVKIDKSFLKRKDFKSERDFIVKMGALIRSVKEEVIFEGIETQEQLNFLVECGFRFGQGFIFDKPVPVKVFEEKYMK